MRSANFVAGMSDSFLFNAKKQEETSIIQKLLKRALPKTTNINISIKGIPHTTLKEIGPSTARYCSFLDIDSPELVEGHHVSFSELQDYRRVIASTNFWGSETHPDPAISVPIIIRAKSTEFSHLEMPVFQIPRVILDAATAISEALANESLSSEASDLIAWSVRRPLIASTIQKMGAVFHPFLKTLEALKFSTDNPALARCSNAIKELKQWMRYARKMKKKLNFGINTITRDFPLILKEDKLLKHKEIRDNTVWWSYDNVAAYKNKIAKLEKENHLLKLKLERVT